MSANLVRALREADDFHKTCCLLFDDFVSYVRTRIPDNAFAWSEKGYFVWHSGASQHLGNFWFEHANKYKFAFMLVKVNEDRGAMFKSRDYYALCNELGVDPYFPLLFVTGVYYPRDEDYIRRDLNARRAWPLHILKLLPDQILQKVNCSPCYRFNEELVFETDPSVGNYWCNRAEFKVRRLTDIKNQEMLTEIAEELLAR